MKRGHIPIRQCIGCKKRVPQFELIRFGLKHGIVTRIEGKSSFGRSCYTCEDKNCIELALKKGNFSRALRCNNVVLSAREALLNGLETEGIIDDDDDR
jgi:uncharacterized protein